MSIFDQQNYTIPEGRVEAVDKVTGRGKYAAEYEVENMCYAVLVGSTIPSGTITAIDLTKAQQVKGVVDFVTHLHKPDVPGFATESLIKESRFGLPIFHTNKIYFKGQPIVLVIAETLEEATFAASLVEVQYQSESFQVDFDAVHPTIPLQEAGKERGLIDAWKDAQHVVEEEYTIKAEVHNPMEMHATLAHWIGEDRLKLYDKTQGVNNVQQVIAPLFKLKKENVEVVSEFVGGGFGSGLRVWPHVLASIMAAKQVKRPVKLMLTRPQMFIGTGYRPASWQKIKIGADNSGKFLGIFHQAKNETSLYERFSDQITRIARLIYNFDNLKTEDALVPLNLNAATWMRGPGDCTGDFAIECAIDELSYQLKMDPLAIRLKNIASSHHPDNKLPWSSNHLKECMEIGATRIQWNDRNSAPNATKEGDWRIGYGMAVGMWNAGRNKTSAAIVMKKDGTITIQTAMTDIGTGTGTGMKNVAHEATGIPKDLIKIELGNSNLPPAPSQGGSTGMSSVSGAVVEASNALKLKLAEYAALTNPKFKNLSPDDILLSEKGISLKKITGETVSYADLWAKNKLDTIVVDATSGPGEERKKYAFCSSAAHFCQVRVNIKTGKVKIEKMVCVADGGKIVNEKAAANQMSGAAIGGIGMALMEEKLLDPKSGGLIGDDLAGYHFPVNADAPIIDVSFIGKADPYINPTGAKGLGEVGIIGTAAAIANAIYHATGKRIRNLPITPDKILV
ncbi:xanthine dehydrogenase family protein molybdopterin-binding subunit [Sphingobacterium sp. SRCM116780]|uniref:xanthine dehydrogenase family protein molybdopterin-binding subunit n=1 Tax=Sphingobacterium sp. SRCM116780 TaxID=2907623 RepID=UPI001F37A869|nr:xanthine dehydrogenase family protein molybdopterin-binding subunit [Sphingobacterium sp. SRCM116780]UIR56848.1 xanthine dehydrogenase family protein molybdopterin-binding subunit [Sphingobacterium sp. SRCM116780]